MAQKQENRLSDSNPYSFQLGCLSFSRNHGNQQRMLVLQTGYNRQGKPSAHTAMSSGASPVSTPAQLQPRWETPEESLDGLGEDLAFSTVY